MKKLLKNFHKNRRLYYGLIIFFVTFLLGLFIFVFGIMSTTSSSGSQVINSNQYYTLRGTPTTLERDLFDQLSNELEKEKPDELVVAELVAKCFISDYYTWSNKTGPYDIGGSDFVMPEEGTNFYYSSRLYYYNSMYNYINNDINTEDLVQVETISDSTASYGAGYDYYGTSYLSFYIELSWTYKTSDIIDTSLFPTSAAITLIERDDGRIEIVRFY